MTKKIATLPERAIEGGSLVLIGHFNPSIFHPLWFAKQDLLSAAEADSAEVQLIHPEVAAFSIEWLSVQVTKERFTATASDFGHLEPLRDLVDGTFGILEHTPISKMGFNHDLHYRVATPNALHEIMEGLTQDGMFKEVLHDSETVSIRKRGTRRGIKDAMVQFSIELSTRVSPGVYFGVNEHYDAGDSSNETGNLMAKLRERWRTYHIYARDACQKLLSSLTLGVID